MSILIFTEFGREKKKKANWSVWYVKQKLIIRARDQDCVKRLFAKIQKYEVNINLL